MTGTVSTIDRSAAVAAFASRQAGLRQAVIRWLLTGIALLFLGAFLLVPLAAIFSQAFEGGLGPFVAAITEPDARSALRLTLFTAALAVPLNLVFGVAAAWAIARFEFRGKQLLTTLIDLPFAVSP